MRNITRTTLSFLFSLLLVTTALAQTPRETALPIDGQPAPKQPATQSSIPLVTATASSQRVRYVAMGEVNQTRLQVFSGDGAQVFDSDFKLGNLIDWQLTDQQGARLTDGAYLFLVTVKDFSGALTQKYGTATFEHEQVYLQQSTREELPPAQVTALEANRQAELLSAIDRIGVAAVPGTTTSATEGTTAIDGAPAGKQTSTTPTTAGGTNLTGTGTQNKIAKWTDNAGTLGDSSITESTSGNLGVGTAPNSTTKLNVFSPFGTVPFSFTQNAPASSSPTLALFSTSDGTIGQYAGSTNNGAISFVMGATAGNNFGIFANNSFSAPHLFIKNDGNVGIGTTSPGAKLEIKGAGQGAILFDPDQIRIKSSGNGFEFNIQGGHSDNNGGRIRLGGGTRGDTDKNVIQFFQGATERMRIQDGGNVGIGTTSPANKLHIHGGGLTFSDPGGFANQNRFAWSDAPTSTGVLALEARDDANAFVRSLLAVQFTGNVGIGTTTPTDKLTVKTATESYGLTHTDGNVQVGTYVGDGNFNRPPGGWFGTKTNHPLYLYTNNGTGFVTLDTAGNLSQSPNTNGLVKAMAKITSKGSIIQCYNSSQTGSAVSTPPCGITVNHFTNGGYGVDFQFQVNNRFFSITPGLQDEVASSANRGARYECCTSQNSVDVRTYISGNTDTTTDMGFVIIVY